MKNISEHFLRLNLFLIIQLMSFIVVFCLPYRDYTQKEKRKPSTKMLLRSGKRKQVAEFQPRNVRSVAKKPKKAPKQLKLTDLNDHCLQHIFGYLNATELTNVAETSPVFVPNAQSTYAQKYAKKTLHIHHAGFGLNVQNERVHATVPVFMEHFGHLLQDLSLDYSFSRYSNDHCWREIERSIFTHCTNKLTEIELKHYRTNVMEEIQKPFENVETMTISSGVMDQHSIRLSK